MSTTSTFVSLDESVSIDAWTEDGVFYLTFSDRNVELTITIPLVEGVHEMPSDWVTTGGIAKLRSISDEILELAGHLEEAL